MSRPAGSKNKNPYKQDQLPEEYLPKGNAVVEFEDLKNYQLQGEETKMKEMKQVLRTIALSNMTTYDEKGGLVGVSMSETEIYLNQLIASGWELFYVAQTGKNEVSRTIDMLYVFTK